MLVAMVVILVLLVLTSLLLSAVILEGIWDVWFNKEEWSLVDIKPESDVK